MSGGVAEHFTVAATASRDGVEVAVFEFGQGAPRRGAYGLVSTGPLPGTMSTLTPASFMGITMSEKKTGVDLVAADGLR